MKKLFMFHNVKRLSFGNPFKLPITDAALGVTDPLALKWGELNCEDTNNHWSIIFHLPKPVRAQAETPIGHPIGVFRFLSQTFLAEIMLYESCSAYTPGETTMLHPFTSDS